MKTLISMILPLTLVIAATAQTETGKCDIGKNEHGIATVFSVTVKEPTSPAAGFWEAEQWGLAATQRDEDNRYQQLELIVALVHKQATPSRTSPTEVVISIGSDEPYGIPVYVKKYDKSDEKIFGETLTVALSEHFLRRMAGAKSVGIEVAGIKKELSESELECFARFVAELDKTASKKKI